MTKLEYIKKESEKYYGVKVEGKTFHFDDGLSKGLEIAEGFAVWVDDNCTQCNTGEWELYDINFNPMQRVKTTAELLDIYLTENEMK